MTDSAPVRFGILGPALARAADGSALPIGGPRLRALFALLLAHAGQAVTVERLIDGVYGDQPPEGAVNALRSQIARLRAVLGDAVSSDPVGYRFGGDPDEVDVHRFERLARAGRTALGHGDGARAAAVLREALSLWRGPALADVRAAPFAGSLTVRLEELRVTALEDRIEADRQRGAVADLVPELRELVAAHPLRERLRAQLVSALAAAGRPAEALAAYADARRVLADELGADPSPALTAVYLDVLRGQPGDKPSGVQPAEKASGVPRTLPATVADFTGRGADLTAIRQALGAAAGGGRLAVPIVAIAGRAGMGKTTLAVHAAHGLADRFPDGQLFAGLHAGGPHPVDAAAILERFLRMLGVHGGDIPAGVDERAGLFRSLLADRRVLIVLDDVGDEQDVLPLLPGSTSCAVLVTSRRRLAGLAAATVVELGQFSPEHSLELLGRVVGGDRVGQEATFARTLAEQCGYLPLALRIAGARLALRPHWTVRQMAVRLVDEERRLDELVHGGMAIRASLSLNHDALSDPARRLFRLLAIPDAHVFSGWTAAALAGAPVDTAQEALDELVDAQLVQPILPGHGLLTQYRFHDLVRGFARQRLAADEPPVEAATALGRMLDAVLALTRAATGPQMAAEVLSDHSRTPAWSPPPMLVDAVTEDPPAWLEQERPSIVAAVHQASRADLSEVGHALAEAVHPFLSLRAYRDDAQAVLTAALDAARRVGDRRGEAVMLFTLRMDVPDVHDQEGALRDLARTEALFRQLGDRHGTSLSMRAQAFVAYRYGRTTTALQLFTSARPEGRDAEVAYILQIEAAIHLLHGEPAAALTSLAEALDIARTSQKPRVLAQVLYRTGQAHLAAGDHESAAGPLRDALAVAGQIGDTSGEAHVLVEQARVELRRGNPEAAHALLEAARERAAGAHDRLAEGQVLTAVAELDRTRAADSLRQAADRFRSVGSLVYEAQALVALAEAQRTSGDEAAADATRTRAAQLVDRMEPALAARLRERL
ncbi:NB-ARC domain-containing protein [Actinoplanes sp. TRM 88003]|uniref:NB-ARC domain-containing protein n=1 Tax=Paractinoplanes aksuensis TaxID=2939490 RepID=A0ABT1DS37_9ACTN|nr:AfsR/SARP family transcriptional regulator [Actinoplanes aksuensis]MCO8273646.1 NB-ARC domain-containing protein [Actinoplanes aksuensis]